MIKDPSFFQKSVKEKLQELIKRRSHLYFTFCSPKHNNFVEIYDKKSCLPDIDTMNCIIQYLNSWKEKGQDAIDKYNQAHRKENKKDSSGCIYFLGREECVKIGKTKNIDGRVEALKSYVPFKAELLHSIRSKNVIQDEKKFHKIFAEKRINGEWFKLEEKDIQKIKEIQEI